MNRIVALICLVVGGLLAVAIGITWLSQADELRQSFVDANATPADVESLMAQFQRQSWAMVGAGAVSLAGSVLVVLRRGRAAGIVAVFALILAVAMAPPWLWPFIIEGLFLAGGIFAMRMD